jgi:hypothetical protein
MADEKMIKELENEMSKCTQDFNNNEVAIENAQKTINELLVRREQIRGEYTGLYNLYLKITGKDKAGEATPTTNETVKKENPVVESQPVSVESQKVAHSAQTEASDSLSKNEITAVKAALNNKNNETNQSDIPDYLK